MILQYKGIKNNWCFEEAERIISATVNVGEITKHYREGGTRYEEQQRELNKNMGKDTDIISDLRLQYVQEMHKKVDDVIRDETGASTDIVYLIGDTPFNELDTVSVVMLEGKNIHATYVFDMSRSRECTVYILNSNGGTVLRVK